MQQGRAAGRDGQEQRHRAAGRKICGAALDKDCPPTLQGEAAGGYGHGWRQCAAGRRLRRGAGDAAPPFWDVSLLRMKHKGQEGAAGGNGQSGGIALLDATSGAVLATAKPRTTVMGAPFQGTSGKCLNNGCCREERLVATAMDGGVALLDAASGAVLATAKPHRKYAVKAAALADGRFVTASWDGTLAVHRVATDGAAIETLAVQTYDHAVADLTVLADGKTVVIAGAAPTATRFWPALGSFRSARIPSVHAGLAVLAWQDGLECRCFLFFLFRQSQPSRHPADGRSVTTNLFLGRLQRRSPASCNSTTPAPCRSPTGFRV